MTTDMSASHLRPYFFWDEDVTIGELHAILRKGDVSARHRLLGKMLREARDVDVWVFVTPEEVERALPVLGRRRAFWELLIRSWRGHGLIGAA